VEEKKGIVELEKGLGRPRNPDAGEGHFTRGLMRNQTKQSFLGWKGGSSAGGRTGDRLCLGGAPLREPNNGDEKNNEGGLPRVPKCESGKKTRQRSPSEKAAGGGCILPGLDGKENLKEKYPLTDGEPSGEWL